jgi:putative copper export protein
MHALYIASVVIHLLSAITWIGGMLFLVMVAVPWLRKGDRALATLAMRELGTRFRTVGWVCFGLLIATGSFNLWVRGVRLASFADAGFRSNGFGRALLLKLGAFGLVLLLAAFHDFVLGPRASAALGSRPPAPDADRLRRAASWLGRANALLAIAIVVLAVILVRGWP